MSRLSGRFRTNSAHQLLLGAVTLLLIAACATAPITGRSQLMLFSDDQVIALANRDLATFLKTAQEKNAILSPSESPAAARVTDMVTRVGQRIVAAAELQSRSRWEFITVKAKPANAFAAPNGKIVVFTGILPATQNEGGLAAVLGHEVAHVMARHAAERMSQVLLVNLGLTAANAALERSNPKYSPWIGAALGLGAQYGILLPYSREHESEADRLGLLLMAKAGYDPAEAIPLWERMEAAGGSGPWEFLSTHPSPATRRDQLRRWLPEAQVYYADRTRALPQDLTQLRAVQLERAQHSAMAPLALRPSTPIGYSYRLQATNQPRPYAYRVEETESCPVAECYVVSSEDGRSALYTGDLHAVESRGPGGSVQFRFSPPLQLYQWPLRVGGTWSQSFSVEDSTGKVQKGTLKGDVVGYETVTTKAGSFVAYKIVISLVLLR